MNTNWNHLKKLADDLGNDLNTEDAWNRFEKRREKQKRRLIFWFPYKTIGVFAILIFALFSSQYIFQEKSDSTILSKKENSTKGDLQINNNHIQQLKRQFHALDHNKNNAETVIENSSIPSTQKSNHKNAIPKERNSHSNLAIDNNTKSVSTIHTKFNTNTSKNPNPTIQINHQSKQSNFNSTAVKSKFDSSHRNEKNTINQKEIAQVAQDLNQNILEDEFSREILRFESRSIIHPLQILDSKLAVHNYIQLADRYKKAYKQFNTTLAFQARYIFGFANRTLLGDNSEFINRRKNQEEFRVTNAIELLLTKSISPVFSLSSGLSINHYRSKLFEVNQELVQNISFSDVLLELRTKNGVSQEIRGEYNGSQTIITERIRYQNYVDLSIPFYVDVNIKVLPKLNLVMSAGASISLYNSSNGFTFQSEVSQGMYQKLSQLNYRKIGLAQGIMNISFNLNISDNFDIQFGGQLRNDLNSRIKSGHNTSDKFRSNGIIIGIRKQF